MTRSILQKVAAGVVAALSAFVIAASACPSSASPGDSRQAKTIPTDISGRPDTVSDDGAQPVAEVTIAYYFHYTLRCETCLTMEAYAKEALETHFADAVAAGRLVWRPTNVEEDGNEHYVEDFEIEGSALVLARTVAEEVVAWQNLPAIWDYVDHREGFLEYVRKSVNEILERKAAPATDRAEP